MLKKILIEKKISIIELLGIGVLTYILGYFLKSDNSNSNFMDFIIGVSIAYFFMDKDFLNFLQKQLQKVFSSVIVIKNKKFYTNEKIYFLEPLIHPATKEKIFCGKIIRIENKEIVEIYLADAMQIDDVESCSSWIKTFTKKELEKIVKVDK